MSDNVIRPPQFSLAWRLARDMGAPDIEAAAAEFEKTVAAWEGELDWQRIAFENVLPDPRP